MLCAGVDEVGRGCLAGPVVACAVILPQDFSLHVMDSKKCSAYKREELAPSIKKEAIAWSLGVEWHYSVDVYNIRVATFRAMARAVSLLSHSPSQIYIDGNACIPQNIMEDFSLTCKQEAIIKGDSLHTSISASSIIAKVFRDKLMQSLSKKYPQYSFEQHKGYPTKKHYEELEEFGASAIHRKTFRGVVPI